MSNETKPVAWSDATGEVSRLRDEQFRWQLYDQSALDAAVAAERERCIAILEAHQVPVGNSAAGEMAAEFTMEALRNVRDTILWTTP